MDWQRQTVTVKRRWYRGNMDTPKTAASMRPRWIGPLMDELHGLKPANDGFMFGGEQPIDERNELREKLQRLCETLACLWEPAGIVSAVSTLAYFSRLEPAASRPASWLGTLRSLRQRITQSSVGNERQN